MNSERTLPRHLQHRVGIRHRVLRAILDRLERRLELARALDNGVGSGEPIPAVASDDDRGRARNARDDVRLVLLRLLGDGRRAASGRARRSGDASGSASSVHGGTSDTSGEVQTSGLEAEQPSKRASISCVIGRDPFAS